MIDKELYRMLMRNIGKEIEVSANYTETVGRLLGVRPATITLRINKKRIKHIKTESIYAITEEDYLMEAAN